VVEPEVHHHFLELPFAVSGAKHLGLHQLGEGLALHAHRVHLLGRQILVLSRRSFPSRRRFGCRRVRRLRALGRLLPLLRASRHLRRKEILLGHLARAPREGFESAEPSSHLGVREALGVELLLHVGLQSYGAHALDIARRRPEADPVQDVNDGASVRTIRNGLALACQPCRADGERNCGANQSAAGISEACAHERPLLSVSWIRPGEGWTG
jgi:hypothetical protein